MPQIPKQLIIIILAALVLFALIYQLPRTVRIDIGSPNDDALISGFYFPEGTGENTFRWTSGQAAINFLGFGQRDALLTLRVSGIRPAGSVTVKLTVNDRQPLATLELGGAMQEYEFAITRSQIGQAGDIRLLIETPTFQSPPDARDLGIQIDWAEVRSSGWSTSLPPLRSWLALTVVVALLAAAGSRLRMSVLTLWLWSGGWLVAVALTLLVAQPWLDAYLAWLVGAVLLFWAISGWMGGARIVEWLALAALSIGAVRFGMRALDFFNSGLPPGDFSIYFTAAQNLAHGQPIYDFKAASEMPNGPVYKYPPMFALLLSPFASFPAWHVAAGWYLFNLALYGVIFVIVAGEVGRLYPQRRRLITLLVALLFLNFQPTWESLIRGQLDIFILTSTLIGLWLYRKRKAEWAGGMALAFVTMLKLYPGFLCLYLLWRRRWRALFGFTIGFAALTVLSGWAVGWDVLWRYGVEVLSVQTAAVPYPENQSWDGFLARFVIATADTVWYTTIPFTPFWRWLHYACVLLTFVLTVIFIWRRPSDDRDDRRFMLGYGATLLVMVLLWPTSWMHYQTLLLPAFSLLLADQLSPQARRWWTMPLLAVSFALVAFGNEYTVLTPAINVDGWQRLLQSYKFFGMLLLWGLHFSHPLRSSD